MAGIVIVSFNSADVIDGCLDACLAFRRVSVVVVDNASVDGTADAVLRRPGVRLIRNSRNAGFASAVNQGIAALSDEAVLILNPDAEPLRGIDVLERAVLREGVGAVTGRLVGSDGADQSGFNVRGFPTGWTLAFEALGLNRIWPGNPVNRRFRPPSPGIPSYVEQPAGAFLMIRRSAWTAIGGLDEGFFPIWFEDVDFCKRLWEAGWKIVFEPEAVARHQGGHSAIRLPWKDRHLFWYGSLLRYASKHLPAGERRIAALAVMLACFPRAISGMLQVGIWQPVSVFGRVFRLAGRCLRKGDRGRGTPGSGQPFKEPFEQSRLSR